MKILSCGVIVHYNKKLLACIPFGSSKAFDIPKGHLEENETFIQAATRELYEETGIKAEKTNLRDLGKFAYVSTKDLYLYSYEFDFNLSKCKCISTFDFHGKQVPEVTGYAKVDFSELHVYYKSLQPILRKVIEVL